MSKKQLKIGLVLIIALAIMLRLLKLSIIPSILNRDEAALAYNAYLLKETGMDEWQVKNPFLFKSFGDFKLPGYPYLLAFLFNFFPASDWLVKLPSFLAGLGLVILAFYWSKNILKLSNKSALFVAFLVAINPIFSFYSRIAFEANLALFLFALALYLIFLPTGLKKRYLLDFLALVFIVLAILTYNTPLLLLPFLLPAIIFIRSKKSWRSYLPINIFLASVFLIFFQQLSVLTSQKSAITIFSDPTVLQNYPLYRQSFSGIFITLLGNRYVYFLSIIANNFFASFSPAFVVYRGGSHPWHSMFNWGHLFYSSYFLALAGIVYCIVKLRKETKQRKKYFLILYLLVASLAPAVVTVDAPHATRSLFFFFLLTNFAGIFFENIFNQIKFKKIHFLVLFILLGLEASYYYYQYFAVYPQHQAQSLWPEYKSLLVQANNNYPDEKVFIIDPDGYQYILTAWYLKIPASEFFATMQYQGPDQINFYYGEKLSSYRFLRDREELSQTEGVVISQEQGLERL
jgi:hypothetical protein